MVIINEVGCITHKSVSYGGEKQGVSIWVCSDCQQEFAQYEDLQGG